MVSITTTSSRILAISWKLTFTQRKALEAENSRYSLSSNQCQTWSRAMIGAATNNHSLDDPLPADKWAMRFKIGKLVARQLFQPEDNAEFWEEIRRPLMNLP